MRRIDYFALTFILFVTILKFVHLDADPPPFMSVAEYGDPAQYAYNARNKVLFGEWEIDEKWNLMWVTIIPNFFTYISFLLFGVSYKSMNLVPLVFSFFILVICYLILREYFSEKVTLLGIILIGTNYLFFLYSRIADRVPEMLFFVLLSIYLWLKGLKGSNMAMFFTGFTLWFSYNSKPKILYFIPIFFIAHFLELIRRKISAENIKKTIILITGFLTAIFIWLPSIYLPQREIYERFGSYNMRILLAGFPKLKNVLFYWFSRAPFSIHGTLTFVGITVSFFIFYLVRNYFQKREGVSPLEVMSISWIGIGYSIHSILFWRPLRYYFDFFFPMSFMFLGLLERGFRKGEVSANRRVNFSEILIYFYISLFIFSNILRRLYTPKIYRNLPKFFTLDIALSILLVFLIVISIKYALFFRKIPSQFFGAISLLVAFYTIILNCGEILDYLRNPKFQLKTISEDFGEAFPNSVMAGVWAVSASMNNNIKTYHCWPRLTNTDPDFLKKKDVKYTFLWDDIETPFYMSNFPEMKNAVLRARYHIYHSILEEPYNHRRKFWNLFEIGGKPVGGENFYEAELWTGPFGFPRFLKEASNKFVLSSQKKFASYPVLFSSTFELKKGMNRIEFSMKTEKSDGKFPVCMIVLKREDGKIKKKNIFYSDMFRDGNFEILSWNVEVNKDSRWRLEVYNYTYIDFFIDYVKIVN
ncbi:MAG: ArnT family glycosyltransferase [Candidatus Aminicenantia bacterium]